MMWRARHGPKSLRGWVHGVMDWMGALLVIGVLLWTILTVFGG
jgi:hypothetical protein